MHNEVMKDEVINDVPCGDIVSEQMTWGQIMWYK